MCSLPKHSALSGKLKSVKVVTFTSIIASIETILCRNFEEKEGAIFVFLVHTNKDRETVMLYQRGVDYGCVIKCAGRVCDTYLYTLYIH